MRKAASLGSPSASRCPSCGAPASIALLRSDAPQQFEQRDWPLSPADHLLGREERCDVILPPRDGISRLHARLRWTGKAFEIADAGSSFGTTVDGRRLAEGDWVTLQDGAGIDLGGTVFRYFETATDAATSVELLSLFREMTSLDPGVVVARALNLLREVSGVERAYLVDAGSNPRLAQLLTPLTDAKLKISRSTIEEALASGRTVVRRIDTAGPVLPAHSIAELGLRRIWVAPVPGADGLPVAAVYLDSTDLGRDFGAATSRLMQAVVEQIAIALRNASLHSEVTSLNENLEIRVRERTQALEQSQARLIAQDRLATLGRLVAAIAHELNNPVGAIASLASTISNLIGPINAVDADVASAFPDPLDRKSVRALLDRVLSLTDTPARDTRTRREAERAIEHMLAASGLGAAEGLARRFARSGLSTTDLDPVVELLAEHGESIARLADRVHTFGRGLRTIGDSARNVARIVDGLKTYAHLDQSTDEVADIHRSLGATLSVLESRIPEGVEVVTQFDRIEPFTHRPGELTQVWTNLVDNALRAMEETGTLTLQTRDVGDRVEVSVEDTGTGVPDAIRDRIFDLDVTSRGPGAGLGLGLPICKSIVEKHHGGSIAFESRAGRTRFVVTLAKNPIRQQENSA